MKFTRRPDLDPRTRMAIVRLAWLHQGVYGQMTQIAQTYRISRTFLYQLLWAANLQLEVLFSKDDDPRFETDRCPECSQQVYVMVQNDGENMSTRRRAVHRLKDNKTVCLGGGMVATIDVPTVLGAFLEDRCIKSPSALLTWTSLWAAFQVWCLEHRILPIPAPEAVQEAMGQYGEAINNAWSGWVLRLEEWMGDQDERVARNTKDMPPATHPLRERQEVLFSG